MSMKRSDPKYDRAYDRATLRAAFVSLFWNVITYRKKQPEGFTLQALAKSVGANKAEISRWFSYNSNPNWTLNTVAAIANALGLDLQVRAVERSTGIIFTPAGIESAPQLAVNPQKPLTETKKLPEPQAIVKSNDPVKGPETMRVLVDREAA